MAKSLQWTYKMLKDVAQIITGNTPSRKNPEYFTEAGRIPWAKIADLGKGIVYQTEEYLTQLGAEKARVVPERSIMVSCIGTIGKVGIAGLPMATNQQINTLIFDEDIISPKFGYYFLMSIKDDLISMSARSVMPILNKSNLSNILIPIPTLYEQEYIISVLDELEGLLKLKQYTKKRFEEYIYSAFVSIFGDPELNLHKWQIGYLEDYMVRNPQNGIYKNVRFYNNGYPIVRIENIDGMFIEHTENFKQVELDNNEINKYSLEVGDILVNRINSIQCLGKSAVIKNIAEPMVFESNIVRIRVNQEMVIPEFLVTWLSTPYIKSYIQNRARRSVGQASINQQDILKLPVINVPYEMQRKFVNLLQDNEELKKYLEISTIKVQELFSQMLVQAFRGGISSSWRAKYNLQAEVAASELKIVEKTKFQVNLKEKQKKLDYIERTHCLIINNREYLSYGGDNKQPIEVSNDVLEKINLFEMPIGVSIKPAKDIVDDTAEGYSRLEYVAIYRESEHNFFVELYIPVETKDYKENNLVLSNQTILSEYGDFYYIIERELLNLSLDTSVFEATRITRKQLKERGNIYCRYDNVSIEIKRFLRSLSLFQKALYEEFLLAITPLAIHTALKRLKFRNGTLDIKKYSIQDAVQTVSMLAGFGLLEKVPPEKMIYPKEDIKEDIHEIEIDLNEPLYIELWQWTGKIE